MNKVLIRFVGDGKPIIKFFESEISARAFIDGYKEAIHVPGQPEVKFFLNEKEM